MNIVSRYYGLWSTERVAGLSAGDPDRMQTPFTGTQPQLNGKCNLAIVAMQIREINNVHCRDSYNANSLSSFMPLGGCIDVSTISRKLESKKGVRTA
jgi:hypothetical protein